MKIENFKISKWYRRFFTW